MICVHNSWLLMNLRLGLARRQLVSGLVSITKGYLLQLGPTIITFISNHVSKN